MTPFFLLIHLFPGCLATLVVLSVTLCVLFVFGMSLALLALLASLKVLLSNTFSSCHLTVANRIFSHRLVRNATIINRADTTGPGGV
jgi:hypothetical protein